MTAKDRNSEVFSYLKRSNVNFLLAVILFLLTKKTFKYIFAFVLMQIMTEVIDKCVLCSLHSLPGQRC